MSPYEWKILEWDENPQTNIYKKHIAASVKERAQTLLVPLEEICKHVLCNKHIQNHLLLVFQTDKLYWA